MISTKTFAWIAILEAASFVVLLISMVFKYGFDNDAGVAIMGPIHGFLFIGYVVCALLLASQLKWSKGQTAKIIAAGIIPIAGFFVGERMLKASASPATVG